MKRVIAYVDGYNLYIGRNTLAKCQVPRDVVKPNGFVLHRPKEWR